MKNISVSNLIIAGVFIVVLAGLLGITQDYMVVGDILENIGHWFAGIDSNARAVSYCIVVFFTGYFVANAFNFSGFSRFSMLAIYLFVVSCCAHPILLENILSTFDEFDWGTQIAINKNVSLPAWALTAIFLGVFVAVSDSVIALFKRHQQKKSEVSKKDIENMVEASQAAVNAVRDFGKTFEDNGSINKMIRTMAGSVQELIDAIAQEGGDDEGEKPEFPEKVEIEK